MERRRERRVNVNMNATILNSGELPIGCRVGNLSTSGIMLKQNSDGAKLPDKQSEVEVRLSLKHSDSRKVIELPVKIVREERNQIGGQFKESQPQLLRLVKPNEEAHINEIHAKRTEKLKEQPNVSSEPEVQTASSGSGVTPNQLALWVAILVLFTFAGFLHFDNTQLRDELGSMQQDLAGLATRPTADQALTESSARVTNKETNAPADTSKAADETYTQQFSAIKAQLDDLQQRTRALEQAPITPPALTQPISKSPTPLPATTDNWIVNLLSLGNERAALDFAKNLQTQGINAEVNAEVTDGQRQVWRVQVSGFANRQAAVDFSEQTRDILNLNGVWIYQE